MEAKQEQAARLDGQLFYGHFNAASISRLQEAKYEALGVLSGTRKQVQYFVHLTPAAIEMGVRLANANANEKQIVPRRFRCSLPCDSLRVNSVFAPIGRR